MRQGTTRCWPDSLHAGAGRQGLHVVRGEAEYARHSCVYTSGAFLWHCLCGRRHTHWVWWSWSASRACLRQAGGSKPTHCHENLVMLAQELYGEDEGLGGVLDGTVPWAKGTVEALADLSKQCLQTCTEEEKAQA